MFDKATLDMLSALKLEELGDIISRQERVAKYLSMPFEQRFQFAISDFYSQKMHETFLRLLANAKLKHPHATFNGIAYFPECKLDKDKLIQLSTGNFLGYPSNIIVYGATGSGKSYIACCLGSVACNLGKKTIFYRMPDLLQDFACTQTALQRKRFIRKLGNVDL